MSVFTGELFHAAGRVNVSLELVRSVELKLLTDRSQRRATPSLRVRIPKPDGRERLLGIASLLANVYLHYVLDLWIEWWRKQRHGDVVIIRYADDFVIGFERLDDAEACLKDLQLRFARFGLKLHAPCRIVLNQHPRPKKLTQVS